ncbi:putative rhamnogalacturonate lyase C [Colletotrichum orbiculare MAFF 240422]|uniref:Rhamnogalacturonate lyase C n=1 Tax=Colletotrichum orbiculare (strain 104-T / ATCC 96160 / CBS 514.97 / LARS 414 / MAFF 240422) TaxID=1213857 RepID=A0A484G5L4_COLOR|nr:putative rhamnogalacturonate lyase C [Colletotrichum orbiculare MAFF 240422]
MGLWKSSPSGVGAVLDQPRRSMLSRFVSNPLTTIAKYLHDLFPVSSPPEKLGLTVVCVSDTHNMHPRVPPGDILIHAGDLTVSGTKEEVQNTLDWVQRQPHRYKIVIAGNHDLYLDDKVRNPETSGGELDWGDVIYLNRTSAMLRFETRTLKVFGSPWTPKHGSWAFQYPRSAALNPFTDAVPADTDVLVTHAPPKGHLDDAAGHWGCEKLLEEVWRVEPRLGHTQGYLL